MEVLLEGGVDLLGDWEIVGLEGLAELREVLREGVCGEKRRGRGCGSGREIFLEGREIFAAGGEISGLEILTELLEILGGSVVREFWEKRLKNTA